MIARDINDKPPLHFVGLAERDLLLDICDNASEGVLGPANLIGWKLDPGTTKFVRSRVDGVVS